MILQKLMSVTDVPYVDGTGRKRRDLHELAYNFYLVIKGIRPAFMVQTVDYESWSAVAPIVEQLHLIAARESFILKSRCDQGILFGRICQDKLSEYQRTGSDVVLGHILGYPCSAKLGPHMLFRAYLVINGREVLCNMLQTFEDFKRFRTYADDVQYNAPELNVTTQIYRN